MSWNTDISAESIQKNLPVEIQHKILRHHVYQREEAKKTKKCLELVNRLYKHLKPLFDERFTEHIEVQGPSVDSPNKVKVYFWPIKTKNAAIIERIQHMLKNVFGVDFEHRGSGIPSLKSGFFISKLRCKGGSLPQYVLLGYNFAKCNELSIRSISGIDVDMKTFYPITPKAYDILVDNPRIRIKHTNHEGPCDLECLVVSPGPNY
jgi:hypothetical protein